MAAQNIKVLIVDDHPIVRMGLVMAVNGFHDCVIVGEAETGEEALFMCQKRQPDVVLMDVQMTGIGGIEAAKAICTHHQLQDPGLQRTLQKFHCAHRAKRCATQKRLQHHRARGRSHGAGPSFVREMITPHQRRPVKLVFPGQIFAPVFWSDGSRIAIGLYRFMRRRLLQFTGFYVCLRHSFNQAGEAAFVKQTRSVNGVNQTQTAGYCHR